MIFILLVKDFPWLRHSALKTTTKERNEKLTDFLKNLSMLGAALLLMADRGTKKQVKVTKPVAAVSQSKAGSHQQ